MEKIINNYDVLLLIFRYLDIEDHLKLIEISQEFEYAIVHGVWHSMYKNLRLSRSLDQDASYLRYYPEKRKAVSLQYNAENNVNKESSLTPEAIHTILHHSSIYIQKLELKNIRRFKNLISLKYHNLTELVICDIFIKDTHLQQVAKNCLNLQSLSLKRFTQYMEQTNICVNVFSKMKALNQLKISKRIFSTWNYFDVQQLFSIAHLKTLYIDIHIRDRNDNNGSNNNSTERVYNIENLTIGTINCLQSWNVFLADLILFKNLTKLSLILDGLLINANFLTQINNACRKSCQLSLIGCRFAFKEFPHMDNLMHLTLQWCHDMKYKHFEDIFRKLKLKSLSFVGGLERDEQKDISNYNFISNTLETLNIEDNLYLVRAFFNRQHKFKNVTKIRLATKSIHRKKSRGFCFSHNYPYLQELIMDAYHISSEDILRLKHLKVLQFDLFYNMSWSYLENLFKHPTLTHITITPFYCKEVEKYCEPLPKCERLTTILEYLSLPSSVYKSALNFWPSFRQRNKLLKLKIVNCDTLKNRAVPIRNLTVHY